MGLPGDWLLDDFSLLNLGFPDFSRPRPLTYLTFWLNLQAFGATPWAFRLTNILLHSIGVQLAYRALAKLLGSQRAFFAAAVFAIAPIQADAVLYIFGRSIVLMGIFIWLTLHLWLRDKPWLSLASFTLALLSKEEAIALPLFLLLLDRKKHRATIAAMLALSTATLAATALATATIQGSGAGAQSGINALTYLATQPKVIAVYLEQLALPYFIGFTWQPAPWPNYAAILWLIPIAGLYAIRESAAFPWLAGALFFLLPTSSIFPIADLAAFRRMYIPTALLCAAIPALRKEWTTTAILAFTLITASRATTLFANPSQLWLATWEQQPGDTRALLQYCRYIHPAQALAILEQHKDRATLSAYQTELGRVYLELNRPADALRAFGKALAIDPTSASNVYNRGVALQALGQTEAARADFERALKIDPGHLPAKQALAIR